MSKSLATALAAVAFARFVGFLLSCFAVKPLLKMPTTISWRHREFKMLLRFSSWLSISNIAGPFLTYGDRLYLATVVPTASIAYYTIPFDVTYRASVLPMAGLNALFPALAHGNAAGIDKRKLMAKAQHALFLFWLPPLVIVSLLSREILAIWLGSTFSEHSAMVLVTLTVGVAINGFAYLVATMLHAHGCSDITAKLHLIELPVYGAVMVYLILHFGVIGAALAWSFRVVLDYVLLCVAAVGVGATLRNEI